jgi:hypothetical protein
MKQSSMMKNSFALAIGLNLFSIGAQAGTELKLNSGLISTAPSTFVGLQQAQQTEWIIQFKNHIQEADKNKLIQSGIQIHSYMPEDALIVRATAKQVAQLKSQAAIQAIVAFTPVMKLSPTLGALSSLTSTNRETFIVSLFNQKELNQITNQIQNLSQNILVQKSRGRSIVVTATRSQLLALAAVQGVESVQAFIQVEPLHQLFDATDVTPQAPGDYSDINGYETGTQVMNFEAAWAAGLTGQNQIVGMADTGLDSGDAKAIHPDFQGAVKSGYAVGMFGKTWADPMGHGTHVAGSVLGRGTASGGKLRGGAYSAQIVAQGMWSPVLNNLSVPANLIGMFNQAYADGARIHTNSWGAAANFGAYEKMAASVDEVMFDKQDLLILFAAGNSGVDKNRDGRIDPNSIGTPGTSKNALTVGASENLVFNGGIQKKVGELKSSPESWPVTPITESKLSDDINGLAMFSSRGPTLDGRLKPEIVAPGTNILSVHDQQPGAEVLWGLYNNDYAWSGGTSMATPLTAGAAALARQFLIEKMNIANPSAALVKALLMNSAFDMYPGQYGEVGVARGQELATRRPNSDEGYGRVDLAQMMKQGQNSNTMIVDSSGVATGEVSEATMKLTQAGQVQITLVWTDAPGSVSASKALVNDLDLEVTLPDGKVLAHNDQINNNSLVEAATTEGDLKVRVKGVNVPMGKNGKQPYALVISIR